jgi:hypothetical protein
MARKQYTSVTPDVVQAVKRYLSDPKYQALTVTEIGMMTGISATSVSRISNGEYDHLLEQQKVSASIDLLELQHLFACEQIVKDMIACSKLDDTQEDSLYFPRHKADAIVKKYVPDMVQERLEYLSTVAD